MLSLADLQQQFLQAIANPMPEAVDSLQVVAQLEHFQRVTIYQNNYLATVNTILADVYPVCNQLVGNEFFNAMCRCYAFQHHDQEATHNNCGKNFARFIANFEPAQQLVYLSDVARLEWTLQQCYFSTTPLFISSDYPIDKIWLMHQENSAIEHIDLDQGGVKLIIYQQQFEVKFQVVNNHLSQS